MEPVQQLSLTEGRITNRMCETPTVYTDNQTQFCWNVWATVAVAGEPFEVFCQRGHQEWSSEKRSLTCLVSSSNWSAGTKTQIFNNVQQTVRVRMWRRIFTYVTCASLLGSSSLAVFVAGLRPCSRTQKLPILHLAFPTPEKHTRGKSVGMTSFYGVFLYVHVESHEYRDAGQE